MAGTEKVDRLFFGAFREVSTTRAFAANGSGAGVKFFPLKENLVRSLLIWVE
jgi:hypothetical protein